MKKANSIISNRIGETYFNVLRPQCFRKEYPIVGCIKRRLDDMNDKMLVSSNNLFLTGAIVDALIMLLMIQQTRSGNGSTIRDTDFNVKSMEDS